LRMKCETVEEIAAFAETMREHCRRINPNVTGRLLDTCGTGGDRVKTFNVSTAAAFVIAGAGVAIAKHGNRSVTSHCGSADVLERLGLNLNMAPEAVERAIEQLGVGFMFAPAFHPAMKYAVGPRKEIGIRTIFNVLGPLTNPASANAQLLGVYDQRLTEPVAYVLRKLGCKEAMVVHGLDGLDEISTMGKTAIAWLREGEVANLETVPRDFGVKQTTAEALTVSSPEGSAETIFRIINGCCAADDPKMEMVLVNSAAGIIVGGNAENFIQGMDVARKSVNSGAAYKKFKELIRASGGDLSKLEEMESKYA
jgi:anthranilate phosphoribosyltransferase